MKSIIFDAETSMHRYAIMQHEYDNENRKIFVILL